MDLDETDREILALLQEAGRRSVTSIAEELDLSSAAIHNRIERLETDGVIRNYRPMINPKAIGLDAQAIIRLRVEHGQLTEVSDQLAQLENIQAIRMLSGHWDLTARMYAEDVDALRDTVVEQLNNIEGIAEFELDIILNTEYRNHNFNVTELE